MSVYDAPTNDPVLRHGYGGQLESAAEAFLVQAFENNGQAGGLSDNSVPPVLIAAAMHVLTRTAWTQPSDEQVKADMYRRQESRQLQLGAQGAEPGPNAG